MKISLLLLLTTLFFLACSKKSEILFESMPRTYLQPTTFESLPSFEDENYKDILNSFINNCNTKRSRKIYASLCEEAQRSIDSKSFILNSFQPYLITSIDEKSEGLLTGYYEAELFASKTKSKKYKYPIYTTPKDLINVDLSSIYPELKTYRLRGRLQGNKLVPYDSREVSKQKGINADVICYTDSKIDRFFLEIQGSGKVVLDDGDSLFIGYDNQNGYKYRAIGRYLVSIGALRLEEISLQSIKSWLEKNPSRVDEVLNYNESMVYFKEREQGATGSLGLALTPKRSIAVDRNFIPLGSMLYMSAKVGDKEESRIVFAQDTGGAIKGAVRADLFLGSGSEAMEIAGELKSALKLWILMPKREKNYE